MRIKPALQFIPAACRDGLITALGLPFLFFSGQVLAQFNSSNCGPNPNPNSTDYRDPKTTYATQVENAHFPRDVELLIKGRTSSIGADIQYTIERIPNHHRALASISKYSTREKKDKLPGLIYTAECYFERAILFRPDDHIVHLLYAQFLINKGRPNDAKIQLTKAATLATDNGFTQYNIGSLYFEMKDYAQALKFAHLAMAAGFDRPDLRQRLESVAQWKDPEDSPETEQNSTDGPELPASQSQSSRSILAPQER
jgi:Tfp pilus assembly protein PilF